jgi:hypothetical protein
MLDVVDAQHECRGTGNQDCFLIHGAVFLTFVSLSLRAPRTGAPIGTPRAVTALAHAQPRPNLLRKGVPAPSARRRSFEPMSSRCRADVEPDVEPDDGLPRKRLGARSQLGSSRYGHFGGCMNSELRR